MKIAVKELPPEKIEADTICFGIFDPPQVPAGLSDAFSSPIGKLIDSGEAQGKLKSTATVHVDGTRLLLIGLGGPGEFDGERARLAAAAARKRAGYLKTKHLAWVLPDPSSPESQSSVPLDDRDGSQHKDGQSKRYRDNKGTPGEDSDGASGGDGAKQEGIVAGLVEGTILASYRFDRYKTGNGSEDDRENGQDDLAGLTIAAPGKLAGCAARAETLAEAQNRARDLQNLPANEATPAYLAERAEQIAEELSTVSVEVMGRDRVAGLGLGGFSAVARGSDTEPKLIVMRYRGSGSDDPTIGFVGKAVTFDSGGISIKPSGKMHDMKMDMSGGAAVIEAIGAIARLGVEINLLGVIPATENMPSGHSVKPGDIVTMHNGKTVEVLNTDAEGRLLLADALSFAVESGAKQLVDLATLTGAIVIALGSTYAGLVANDDDLAINVEAAARATGELVWRLPRHAEYRKLTAGKDADLTNSSEKRKAAPLYAAAFLEEFVSEVPWAHLDIAGTAWDVGRDYVGNGPSGYGVRLLVELADRLAAE